MPQRDRDDPVQPKKLLERLKQIIDDVLGYPPSLPLPHDPGAIGDYVTASVYDPTYWLTINSGSFFAVQLNPRAVRGKESHSLKLSPAWLDAIDKINPDFPDWERWAILPGTKGVLSYDDKDNVFMPVPMVFGGGNPVKVLEIKGKFARIQTLNVNDRPPANLLDWMVQNCTFANRPRVFKARMFTLFNDTSAWVYFPQLKKR